MGVDISAPLLGGPIQSSSSSSGNAPGVGNALGVTTGGFLGEDLVGSGTGCVVGACEVDVGCCAGKR